MGFSSDNLFLFSDGTVKGIGNNYRGQLGLGNCETPVTIMIDIPISNVKQFTANSGFIIYVLNDGTVKGAGYNGSGLLGLGSGNTIDQYTLTNIPNLTNVKQVSSGYDYVFYILNDGTVKSCGSNTYGQLGIGSKTVTTGVVQTVPSLTNVKQVACGNGHTMFLLNDGTVKGCGANDYGQLGLGNTTTPITTITDVPISNVKQISCGYSYTIFLLNDGTVKAVGANSKGQLGLGNAPDQNTIQSVPINNVIQIDCGETHTIFLLNDGTVKAVGYNGYGQLGLGNQTNQSTIQTVPNLSYVKKIACGSNHVTFLLSDGTVKGCGTNLSGQMETGNGSGCITAVKTFSVTNVFDLWRDYYVPIIKYLIKKNNAIYSIKPQSYGVIGYDNPTENNFLNNGLGDLSGLDSMVNSVSILGKNENIDSGKMFSFPFNKASWNGISNMQ